MNHHSAGLVLVVLALTVCELDAQQLGPQDPLTEAPPIYQCRPIREIDMCSHVDPNYTNGSFPNYRNQDDIAVVNTELENFYPLILKECSNALVHLLCSVYAPVCDPTDKERDNHRVPPCRHLCEYVRAGCEDDLLEFSFEWPPHLECEQYPEHGPGVLCFTPIDVTAVEIPYIPGLPTNETDGTTSPPTVGPPVLLDLGTLYAVEGDAFPNGSLGLEEGEAFPVPTEFTWRRDGDKLMDTSTLTLSYPELSIDPVSRTDSGNYTLTASNYRLDNDSVLIGTDTGGFYLDVLYGPEFNDDPSLLGEAVAVQGDPITIVCGQSLEGNPLPTVEWRDNEDTVVPRTSGTRYTFNDGPDEVSLSNNSTVRGDQGNWTCAVSVTGPGGEEPLPPITRTTSVYILVPPSPPTEVELDRDRIGPTYFGLQWIPPTMEGEPPFTGYFVCVDPPTEMNYTVPRFTDVFMDESTRNFDVTGLQPGVVYQFTMTAVTEAFGIIAESEQSNVFEANTTFTVPLPECSMVPRSDNGIITVFWDYVHTGGLDLTSVQVLYRLSSSSEYLGWIERDVNCTSDCYVSVSNLTAGYSYVFVTNASNSLGYGEATCDEVLHEFGIPRSPVLTDVQSNAQNKVTISVQVSEAGVGPAPHSLVFDVVAYQGATKINLGEVPRSNYVDDTLAVFTVMDSRLMPGQMYVFSVRAQNKFGSSEFVEFGTPVTISDVMPNSAPPPQSSFPTQTSTPVPVPPDSGESGDELAIGTALAGGAVVVLVVVVIILTVSLIGVVLWKNRSSSKRTQGDTHELQGSDVVAVNLLNTSDGHTAQNYEQVNFKGSEQVYEKVDEPDNDEVSPSKMPTSANIVVQVQRQVNVTPRQAGTPASIEPWVPNAE